ncbi:hypothetical protein HDV00_000340 [Rhizophlyctis rosea]|nr:hypothetical protein HDV00_000340 [Rhizophlyctis rosea]
MTLLIVSARPSIPQFKLAASLSMELFMIAATISITQFNHTVSPFMNRSIFSARPSIIRFNVPANLSITLLILSARSSITLFKLQIIINSRNGSGAIDATVLARERARTLQIQELYDQHVMDGRAVPLVTQAELGQAMVREGDAVQQVLEPLGAPPWVGRAVIEVLCPAIAAAVASAVKTAFKQAVPNAPVRNAGAPVAPVRNGVNGVAPPEHDTNALGPAVQTAIAAPAVQDAIEDPVKAAVQAAFGPLQAAQVNARRLRRNKRAFQSSPRDPEPYQPLAKEVTGFGQPPIPGAIANQPRTMHIPIANGYFMGAAPPPGPTTFTSPGLAFPINRNAEVTAAEIGYLAMFYNDDFGIVGGDHIGMQNDKLVAFLCGE